MKPKHLALTAVMLCLAYGSAQAIGDSLRYLVSTDTVFIEIGHDQTKYTTHTFAHQQTVYSLSRFYAQDIDQLYRLNPELRQAEPSIGQQVRVAVPNVAITRFRHSSFDKTRYVPICYRVRPGETMYRIAKTIFRMPVDTLMAVNQLDNQTLSLGQVIQVGWMPVVGAGDRVKTRPLDPLQKVNYANYKRYVAVNQEPRKLVRGVATWREGTGEASGRLYALSARHKPGALLKITNPANKRFAYVEVIGSLADNVRSEQIDLMLSGTAARLLEANEQNFYVSIE